MTGTDRFDAKDPGELLVLTFDYTLGLDAGESLVAPFDLVVSVDEGGPDTNSNSILNGSAEIDEDFGVLLLVPVKGGLDFTDYRITTKCATTNPFKTLVVAGILPVRAA